MDTKAVAELLGTEAKILRRFLRDKRSTFQAVGSGARYEFTETDLPELGRRFNEWAGKRQANRVPVTVKQTGADTAAEQRVKDMAIWQEEGPVQLADLRDPKVRAQVRAKAKTWDQRLNDRLMAAGLHLSQLSRFKTA
jgi:hypothetical protein